MRSVSFSVDGTPAPQGSHRLGLHGGKPVILHDNDARLAVWRKEIAVRARPEIRRSGGRFSDAVSVTVLIRQRRPKSAPKRPYPSVRPDADKLGRACLDALTSADAWSDDGQVVHLAVWEVYADRPGASFLLTDEIPDPPEIAA